MVVRAMTQREKDIECFYELLDRDSRNASEGKMHVDGLPLVTKGWPRRGVYFFFEEGETRYGNPESRPSRGQTLAHTP